MYFQELVIPEGVDVEISKYTVMVSGPKGSQQKTLELEKGTNVEKTENKLKISSENEERKVKAKIGTSIAHVQNMIDGVTKGFVYKLKVIYSHFPITVKVEKDKVMIQNFLGERTSRIAKIIGETQVKIEGQEVSVTGTELEEVSQTAANIEQATRIVGFDKKVFQDGIYITQKGG
ncbi:MAG: 50S ribosomal protein L6 [Candidatus Aenigmarchaeota archaeon]|nr:50S ribosomal protein L6 [Candidatus Aenigmarchaeota archaeon]